MFPTYQRYQKGRHFNKHFEETYLCYKFLVLSDESNVIKNIYKVS